MWREPNPSRRWRLWEEEGRRCHWCRRPTRLVVEQSGDQATIDHVLPRRRGGSNRRSNLVSACYRCNQRRNREDHLGLADGALLKQPANEKPKERRKRKTGSVPMARRVALSGDEKKAIGEGLEALPHARRMMSENEVLREQRDQGLQTITDLRTELKIANAALAAETARANEAAAILELLTFRELFERKLARWLRRRLGGT